MDARLLAARLALCVAIALLATCVSNPAMAQAQLRPPKVAVVIWTTPSTALLEKTLAERGWIAGKNFELLWRTADYGRKPLAGILDELLGMAVDVLVLSSADMGPEAVKRTKTVPIVVMYGDSSLTGQVASLARPGGNVTGAITEPSTDLDGKRLTLLKEAAPRIRRVAYLYDPVEIGGTAITAGARAAVARLGLALVPCPVRTAKEVEAALEAAVRQGADSIFADSIFLLDPAVQPVFRRVVERHKLPAVLSTGAAANGILYYGLSQKEVLGRTAAFVDRILRGARPADLPIEQPDAYHLVVNLKGARAIGLTIPQSLLMQADQVIE